jgi:hypothetical protein
VRKIGDLILTQRRKDAKISSVLLSALDDLANGREFYNQQQEGVGDYFFDSVVSEVDSLVLYAGLSAPVRSAWKGVSLLMSAFFAARLHSTCLISRPNSMLLAPSIARCPTIQISDPAPLILDCKPERHRRVHCIC